MTRSLPGLNWLPAAGLAVVLAAILGLLYVRSRGYDVSGYQESVGVLRQLQQLDARWELDVLKSRAGLETNYDPLVDPLVGLNSLWNRLQASIAKWPGSAHAALEGESQAYHRAFEEKVRLVEHFKSHSSVLRNSLAFLPTAAEDCQKAAARAGEDPALTRLAVEVNNALLDTLIYSRSASDDKARDIQNELPPLKNENAFPSTVRAALEVFAAHVRTVLREQPRVNMLLKGIAAAPTTAHLDGLERLLSNSQEQGEWQAQRYRRDLLIFVAAMAALLLHVALRLIRSHTVINRVNRQLQHANETLEHRVEERTRELQKMQSELVAAAREAGMAEIAIGVLHNIGNVLNSLGVSCSLLLSGLRKSRVGNVKRVAQVIRAQGPQLSSFLETDPRGQAFPTYLEQLGEHLSAENAEVRTEAEAIAAHIAHIGEIVAAQQAYARRGGINEEVDVTDLIDQAISFNFTAGNGIALRREYQRVPRLVLDRHKLIQIVANLLSNARHALRDQLEDQRMLTVSVRPSEPASVAIEVEDSGVGISAETLPRLFTFGFTTKKDGHGFGLHASANLAKELGGELTAHSEGVGKGARFILRLPVKTGASIGGSLRRDGTGLAHGATPTATLPRAAAETPEAA
jgi:two-component system, NtrC family, sensor kinase